MSPRPPIYHLTDVTFRYGELFELSIPDFSIDAGAAVGFIGPNGGGKTTLLRILAFIEKPQSGAVYFDGRRPGRDEATLSRSVSMLLQEPYLLKRSVFENVAYGLKVRGDRGYLRQRVDEALATVGLEFKEFARRSWYELSGGEAQRVALAARLVLKPRVLILDEPTASVDEKSALLIKDAVIESRKSHGTTLVIASHDHFWLNSITTDIRRVARGRITGHAATNLIPGPWSHHADDLFQTVLADGQQIFAPRPPEPDARGMIDPSDIVLSLMKPGMMSAQNMLLAGIVFLELDATTGIVRAGLDAGGTRLTAHVTRHAAREMNLLPGEKIWAVFKAAAVRWE